MRQNLFYSSGAGKFFLAYRIRISACFTRTDNSISPMLSHPGPDKNHVYLMHRLYRRSRIHVVKWRWLLQPLRQKMTLCKLDVNVKNRTAVAGSFDFFKLEKKLFNGKSATL